MQQGWLSAQQWVAAVRQSIMKSVAAGWSSEAQALSAALQQSEAHAAREQRQAEARSFDAKLDQCRGSVRAVSGTLTTAVFAI